MIRLLYHIIYILHLPVALFPLRLLYFISDVVYYPVYYIIRYRRKLVRRNLINALPYQSQKEIIALEKSFYHHFCDYFFETVKLLHISDEEMKKRFIFKNMDQINACLQENRPVILMLGHYGNWEWVTSITLWIKEMNDTIIGQIYRPLKNKAFDLFFFNLRKRFHSVGFAKNDIYREIIKMRRTGQNWLVGFISDQKPSSNSLHYWTEFLHQDTPALIGSERIARQTNAAVFYLDIIQTKRGYYESDVVLISKNPLETAEFEITEKYMRLTEHTILRNPAFWLWTHNRWKHQYEEHS